MLQFFLHSVQWHCCMITNEFFHVLQWPIATIANWRCFLPDWSKVDCRESTGRIWIWSVVCRRIHLCYNKLFHILESLGKVTVHRFQLLAVTAPWCIELNKHILVIVQYDLVKRFTDNHSYWTRWLLWYRLRLDLVLDIACMYHINTINYLLQLHCYYIPTLSVKYHVSASKQYVLQSKPM